MFRDTLYTKPPPAKNKTSSADSWIPGLQGLHGILQDLESRIMSPRSPRSPRTPSQDIQGSPRSPRSPDMKSRKSRKFVLALSRTTLERSADYTIIAILELYIKRKQTLFYSYFRAIVAILELL